MNEKLFNKCQNKIFLNKKYIDKYVVYAVYNSEQQLVFIHYGTLKEIISMRPLNLCDGFNDDEFYSFVLLNFYSNKIDAENAVSYWINVSELQGSTPPLNGSLKLYNSDAFIQCLENGRFYKSSVDVAKIFGVAQSALSNHLRGVTGYRSVKGLHFKRYYGERPAEIELYGGLKMQSVYGGYKTVPSDDPVNTKDNARALEELRMRGLIAW